MLERVCYGIVDKVFVQFPIAKPLVMEVITETLQGLRSKTQDILEVIIDAEQNYFFTNDAQYMQDSITEVSQQSPRQSPPLHAQSPR